MNMVEYGDVQALQEYNFRRIGGRLLFLLFRAVTVYYTLFALVVSCEVITGVVAEEGAGEADDGRLS